MGISSLVRYSTPIRSGSLTRHPAAKSLTRGFPRDRYRSSQSEHRDITPLLNNLGRVETLEPSHLRNLATELDAIAITELASQIATAQNFLPLQGWILASLRRIDEMVHGADPFSEEGSVLLEACGILLSRLRLTHASAGHPVLENEVLTAFRQTRKGLSDCLRASRASAEEGATVSARSIIFFSRWEYLNEVGGYFSAWCSPYGLETFPHSLRETLAINEYDRLVGTRIWMTTDAFFTRVGREAFVRDVGDFLSKRLVHFLDHERYDLAKERAKPTDEQGMNRNSWVELLTDVVDTYLGNLTSLWMLPDLEQELRPAVDPLCEFYADLLSNPALYRHLPAFFRNATDHSPNGVEFRSLFGLSRSQIKVYRTFATNTLTPSGSWQKRQRVRGRNAIDFASSIRVDGMDERENLVDYILADLLQFKSADHKDRILDKIGRRRPVLHFLERLPRLEKENFAGHFLATLRSKHPERDNEETRKFLRGIFKAADLDFKARDFEADLDREGEEPRAS